MATTTNPTTISVNNVGPYPPEILNKLAALNSAIQRGTCTLASGVYTVQSVTLTANSFITVRRLAQGGTSTAVVEYEALSANRTAGANGTGSFTIQASTVAGAAVTTDTSTVEYLIVG